MLKSLAKRETGTVMTDHLLQQETQINTRTHILIQTCTQINTSTHLQEVYKDEIWLSARGRYYSYNSLLTGLG